MFVIITNIFSVQISIRLLNNFVLKESALFIDRYFEWFYFKQLACPRINSCMETIVIIRLLNKHTVRKV